MPFEPTPIPGLSVYSPRVIEDDRGYFFEAFNQRVFEEAGIRVTFVQDNQARSHRGVLRGMHYQTGDFAQAKLVRVVQGKVFDVAVDIRPDSDTYGQSFSVVLSQENKKQLFIPRGFAHGYLVLSETAEFFYKCDNFYSRDHEGGIRFNDSRLALKWPLPAEELVLSERDLNLPFFGEHRS